LLLLYVDDTVITGSDHASTQRLKQQLHASFHMKDLGNLHCFLGFEVHSTSKGFFLHQHKYPTYLISMAGLQSTNPVDTPLLLRLMLNIIVMMVISWYLMTVVISLFLL